MKQPLKLDMQLYGCDVYIDLGRWPRDDAYKEKFVAMVSETMAKFRQQAEEDARVRWELEYELAQRTDRTRRGSDSA